MLDQYLPEVIELWKSEKRNLELAILQQVKKVEEGTIFMEVMGHVQEEIAEKMKPDLIGIFRKKSGAGKISIQLDVKEEDDAGAPKLYTDQPIRINLSICSKSIRPYWSFRGSLT